MLDLGDTEALFADPLNTQQTSQDVVVIPSESTDSPSVMRSLLGNMRVIGQAFDVTVEGDPITKLNSGAIVTVLRSQGVTAEKLVRANNNTDRLIQAIEKGQYRANQLAHLGFTFLLLVRGGLTVERWKEMRKQLPVSEIIEHMRVSADTVFTGMCDSQATQLPVLGLSPQDWVDLCHPVTPATYFHRCGTQASHLKLFVSSISGDEHIYSLEAWSRKLGLREVWLQFSATRTEEAEFVLACTTFKQDAEAAAKEFQALFGHLPDLSPRVVNGPEHDYGYEHEFGRGVVGGGGARHDLLAGRGLVARPHVLSSVATRPMGFGGPVVRGGRPGVTGGSLGGPWVPDHLRL